MSRREFKGPGKQKGIFGVIAGVASLVGPAFGIDAAGKAGRAAEREAALEAQHQREITQERLRQIDVEGRRIAGETRATAAGSGVAVGEGSPMDVLAEQASEFAREKSITSRVGANRVATSLRRGEALAKQYESQQLVSAFSGLSKFAGQAYEFGWFD